MLSYSAVCLFFQKWVAVPFRSYVFFGLTQILRIHVLILSDFLLFLWRPDNSYATTYRSPSWNGLFLWAQTQKAWLSLFLFPLPLLPAAVKLACALAFLSSSNKMVLELKKKTTSEISKENRLSHHTGLQARVCYYNIPASQAPDYSEQKRHTDKSKDGGAAFLYDLIWKIKSLGKYNLFILSRPCCANLQSGSTLWRSKNIYFILLGIKAFNECIIKTKRVSTALEIPLLSQAINIQGTIPSCDSTCFLFGLQPSYKSWHYMTTQPGVLGKDYTPEVKEAT